MHKKILFILVWLLIGLIGCGKKEPAVIKIGAVFPFTGESAQYGKASKLGLELAIEEINAKGGVRGKKIEIIYEDDQGLPQPGVSAFQKLVNRDKVHVIIGPLWSSVTLAIAPIAEREKVVVLSTGSSSPKVTTAGDYIFRNEISDEYGAKESAKLYYNLGFRRIVILYINNDYGNGVRDVTSETYERLGGSVLLSEAFPQNAIDFRSQISKITKVRPEAILIVGYKEQIQILKQMKELGVKQQILGTPLLEDAEVVKEAGDAAEHAIYSYYGSFDASGSDTLSKKFIGEFQSRWGEVPSYYAPIAYDAGIIISHAIDVGGLESDSIKNALYRIKDFPGVSGITGFDSNGDVVKPVILKKIEDNKFVLYSKVEITRRKE